MEEKKLTDEELKKAFFILRHGSSEGLSEYIKAVLAIESEYARQKAEIERLTEELKYYRGEISIKAKESYKGVTPWVFLTREEAEKKLKELQNG